MVLPAAFAVIKTKERQCGDSQPTASGVTTLGGVLADEAVIEGMEGPSNGTQSGELGDEAHCDGRTLKCTPVQSLDGQLVDLNDDLHQTDLRVHGETGPHPQDHEVDRHDELYPTLGTEGNLLGLRPW